MKKRNGGFYYANNSSDVGANADRSEVSEEKVIKDKVEEYGGMSEDRLLDELFAEAAAARRRGELDDKKLKTFYDSVKGMLNAEQRRRLDVLMRALASDK